MSEVLIKEGRTGLWWCDKACGYTSDIRSAGIFDSERNKGLLLDTDRRESFHPVPDNHDVRVAQRIATLEAQLAEARLDTQRLNELEAIVVANTGGLLIHHQVGSNIAWRGVGLGLAHGPLRKAIDGMRPIRPAMENPNG